MADVERKPLDSYVTPEREAAFRAAYEQHLRTVYRYLVSRSENRSDVPDLVAEVFATLWRRGGPTCMARRRRPACPRQSKAGRQASGATLL